MKKFEYLQIEYSNYPSTEELNVVGIKGWELTHIHIIKKRFFDSMLETYCVKEIYQATFKREVLSTS